MLALKLVGLLSIVCACGATDLSNAKWMVECSKKALLVGVPSLGIPAHNPLSFLAKRNIDINTHNPLVGNFHLQVNNMTWANLANWTLKASQNNLDTDAVAVFPFNLYWKSFVMEGLYDLTLYGSKSSGKITITTTENNWHGEMRVAKPSKTHHAQFTKLAFTWHVDDVEVDITGNVVFKTLVAKPLALAMKTALNTNAVSGGFGPLLQSALQKRWANNSTKVEGLINWCKSNAMPLFID